MDELDELYQELILDHNKNPRNFRELSCANRKLEGYNPLCGDRLTVYLKIEANTIKDISFKGNGCAISTASASLMTDLLKGKSVQEAHDLFIHFRDILTGKDPGNIGKLGKLVVLKGVREFPIRVKCATLAWHTLDAALKGKNEAISTE